MARKSSKKNKVPHPDGPNNSSGQMMPQQAAYHPNPEIHADQSSLRPYPPQGMPIDQFQGHNLAVSGFPAFENIFAVVERQMGEMMNQINAMFSATSMFQPGFMPNISHFHSSPPVQIAINDPNAKTYTMSQSQTMQYSNLDGEPKLVRSHEEREVGPNGVWRQRRAHMDTSKGIAHMQEGLFIGDQGEIRERFRNPQTGNLEDRRYHRNVPEQHKFNFVNEWNRRAEEARQMFYAQHPTTTPNQQYLAPNAKAPHYPITYK